MADVIKVYLRGGDPYEDCKSLNQNYDESQDPVLKLNKHYKEAYDSISSFEVDGYKERCLQQMLTLQNQFPKLDFTNL